MGIQTKLYGIILEYGLGSEKLINKIYDHNEQVINRLPLNDKWPPLSRNMFSITKNSSDLINYSYNGRIIHFGGAFKSIELDWEEWKCKFENLLYNLYWLEAEVYLKCEYSNTEYFRWKIDLSKTKFNELMLPIEKDQWQFHSKIIS